MGRLVKTRTCARGTARSGGYQRRVIYAEISVQFTSFESLDAVLKKIVVDVAPIPRPALFFAGKAFQQYRSAGGLRTGVLADFFIGAHATIQNIPIVTRDVRRYRHC